MQAGDRVMIEPHNSGSCAPEPGDARVSRNFVQEPGCGHPARLNPVGQAYQTGQTMTRSQQIDPVPFEPEPHERAQQGAMPEVPEPPKTTITRCSRICDPASISPPLSRTPRSTTRRPGPRSTPRFMLDCTMDDHAACFRVYSIVEWTDLSILITNCCPRWFD